MSLESSPSSVSTAGPLTTLRIIVFALVMGVTTFAGFAVSQNINKPHTIAGNFDTLGMVFLAMGLAALPLGMILPRIIFAASRGVPATKMNWPPGTTPEQARTFVVQQRIQTSAIIGCAIFEGAAFANVLAYMQTREVVHLALAGVLLVGILAHFPTAGSYQRRINDELRRMDEEQTLRRQP
jgi:hypothetical protein